MRGWRGMRRRVTGSPSRTRRGSSIETAGRRRPRAARRRPAVPAEVDVRDDPDDLASRSRRTRRRQVEAPIAVSGVLGEEAQAGLDRRRRGTRPAATSPTSKSSSASPSASMTAGLRAQVADLLRVGLGEDEQRLAVPPEPDRDDVRRAVGADGRQPDDRLLLEEPRIRALARSAPLMTEGACPTAWACDRTRSSITAWSFRGSRPGRRSRSSRPAPPAPPLPPDPPVSPPSRPPRSGMPPWFSPPLGTLPWGVSMLMIWGRKAASRGSSWPTSRPELADSRWTVPGPSACPSWAGCTGGSEPVETQNRPGRPGRPPGACPSGRRSRPPLDGVLQPAQGRRRIGGPIGGDRAAHVRNELRQVVHVGPPPLVARRGAMMVRPARPLAGHLDSAAPAPPPAVRRRLGVAAASPTSAAA